VARNAGGAPEEKGFTLVELLIAMLILAIVLVALAPAFYSALRGTNLSDEHSVASGLAVAASEQMRSYPYYEIGYTSSDYTTPSNAGYAQASKCAAANPVSVTTSAIDNANVNNQLPTSTTVNHINYSIQRCIYWVNSTVAPDTLAYKQSVVTVSWNLGKVHGSVSQTSAIYPGGEGKYTQPTDNYDPATGTAVTVASPPSAPVWVSYAADPTLADTIDLVWSEPSTTPTPAASYEVDYSTTYGGSGFLNLTPGSYTPADFNTPGTASIPNSISVGATATYYMEVRAIAADGTTASIPSPVVAVTVLPQTSGACQLSNLVVNPTTIELNKYGTFKSISAFSLSLNAVNNCNNVTVAYTTAGATVNYAPMSSGSGTLTGTAGTCTTIWNPGNMAFTVYHNGSLVPNIVVQVNFTQGNSSSNGC
jgi:prepilin-type N-terminal cleavage/methylation domain-containing protein